MKRSSTPASNNRAHAGLDDHLMCKLQNPDFRAAYEAEDKRIERALQTIKPLERNHRE